MVQRVFTHMRSPCLFTDPASWKYPLTTAGTYLQLIQPFHGGLRQRDIDGPSLFGPFLGQVPDSVLQIEFRPRRCQQLHFSRTGRNQQSTGQVVFTAALRRNHPEFGEELGDFVFIHWVVGGLLLPAGVPGTEWRGWIEPGDVQFDAM